MTLEEFVEKYNGAPWDYETYAKVAKLDITEDCDFKDAAIALVNALNRFEEALDATGIEMG